MIFSSTNKLFPKDKSNFFINGNEIPQVMHTKFLRVTTDENLTWKEHINLVCRRSMKMLGILRKVCTFIHPSSHLIIYYILIFSYLNYCNIVWGSIYPTYLSKILITQKKFLRLISHSNSPEPSAPLFKKYSILSVDKLNAFQICTFIFKYLKCKHNLPDSLSLSSDPFTLSSDIHTYPTRRRNDLHLLFCHTTLHHL